MRLMLVMAAGVGLAGCVADPSEYTGAPYAPGSGGYAAPSYGGALPGYPPGYYQPGYVGGPVIVPQVGVGIGFGQDRFDRDRYNRDRFDRDRFDHDRGERERFEQRRGEQFQRERAHEPDRGRPPEIRPYSGRPIGPSPVPAAAGPRPPAPDRGSRPEQQRRHEPGDRP